ncbi:STAS domain-containing protein [Massilia sp. W12]|uniref:STAS domain-containing protein n=1 Tax=Massilia sp. W12 TaxID=3126507 RepID=UPI0030CE2414
MAVLSLEGDFTIYQAAELKPLLLQVLQESRNDGKPLELDMSAVTECDGAGMQLLLALAKSASEFGVAVYLRGLQQTLLDMLELYGVSNRFVVTGAGNE